MSKRTYGRNPRHLTLAACCVVLSALCVYAAGRYEMERRHNRELQDHVGTLNIKLDLVRQSAEAAASAEVLAERAVYKKAAEDLSRRLGRYEAAADPDRGEYGEYGEYVTVATVPPGKPLGRALDALGRAGVDCTFDGRPRGYDLAVRPADTGAAWRALRRDAVGRGYQVTIQYARGIAPKDQRGGKATDALQE